KPDGDPPDESGAESNEPIEVQSGEVQLTHDPTGVNERPVVLSESDGPEASDASSVTSYSHPPAPADTSSVSDPFETAGDSGPIDPGIETAVDALSFEALDPPSSSQVEVAPESLAALLNHEVETHGGDAVSSEPEPAGPEIPDGGPARRMTLPPTASSSTSVVAPRLRVALALFALTFISTTAVHLALMLQPESLRELIDRVRAEPTLLRPALIYSLALMGILLVHELGHSLTSLACKVQQSYPYFIPFPSVIGTLGSVVFLRSRPPNRSALLRMAVAGPLVGLLAAIPIAAYGLTLSTPIELSELEGGSKWLGNSMLFVALANAFSPNGIEVQLHPLAFAGWVGMFVTSLNLIPAAQLDGGHLGYALFGRGALLLSFASVIGLFAYGIYLTLEPTQGAFAGAPWLIWGTLIFISGFGHPRVENPDRPLRKFEWAVGIVTFALLVLTFVPVPIQILPDNPGDAPFIEEEDPPEQDWSVEDTDYPPESFDL
ncbi:MAG: site-2 protease family protein, partial [Myxococcota bacterium]